LKGRNPTSSCHSQKDPVFRGWWKLASFKEQVQSNAGQRRGANQPTGQTITKTPFLARPNNLMPLLLLLLLFKRDVLFFVGPQREFLSGEERADLYFGGVVTTSLHRSFLSLSFALLSSLNPLIALSQLHTHSHTVNARLEDGRANRRRQRKILKEEGILE